MAVNQRLSGSQTLSVKKTRTAQPLPSTRVRRAVSATRSPSNCTPPNGLNNIPPDANNPTSIRSAPTTSREEPASPSLFRSKYPWSLRGHKKTHYTSESANGPKNHTPRVLCPHVAVTAEVTALEAGQQGFWAAIEVSSRLSELLEDPAPRHLNMTKGSFIDHELGLFATYDC